MTMKTTLLTSALILAAMNVNAEAAPGFRTQSLEVDHRKLPLALHVWYPAEPVGETITLGKNAVFTGVDVRPGAPALPGSHPLVVLSHGSGGNAVNIAWIAASLADRGMIVVAPNHPGTTSNDSHPDQTVKLWERPQDLSAVIDLAESGGLSSMQVDKGNISAVGFSLGGCSVLALAGAQADQTKYIDYCKKHSQMMDCAWFAKAGVDFTSVDRKRYEASHADSRIKTVVAIDPALAEAYKMDSLKAISVPIKLINLGEKKLVPAAISATKIVSQFGNADLDYVEQATHFSFLGECTKLGPMIIKASLEEPICSETGNRQRADIHNELKQLIGDYLEVQLSN